ncbi:hypothetical protein ACFLYH_03090 [Candidatus Dependentiae bacterium]
MKKIFQKPHLKNFLTNTFSAIAAYYFHQNKPSIGKYVFAELFSLF